MKFKLDMHSAAASRAAQPDAAQAVSFQVAGPYDMQTNGQPDGQWEAETFGQMGELDETRED